MLAFGLDASLFQVRLRRFGAGDQVARVQAYNDVAACNGTTLGREPGDLALPQAGKPRHLDDLRLGVLDDPRQVRRLGGVRGGAEQE